jgi:mannitol/fructose-specific phosphotransferase system IIA component (Ntr-type)/transcriptional antiterminator
MKDRQKKILKILYDAGDYVTTKAITSIVGCSPRTVRTDIQTLKEQITEAGFSGLESKSSKGYRLCLSQADWEQLTRELIAEHKQEVYSLGMQGEYPVLELLLKNGVIQMNWLEFDLYSSYKNVTKYVDKAESWLKKRNVGLERKRGHAVSVKAPVHWTRLAMWSLFCELENQRAEKSGTTDSIRKFLGDIDLAGVQKTINRVETRHHFHFSYSSYRRLVFLLALTVLGHRKKECYRFPFGEIPQGTFEAVVSEECLESIRKCYGIPLSENEVPFLWYAVASSEILGFSDSRQEEKYLFEHENTVRLADSVIQLVEGILQIDLSGDTVLTSGLQNYLSALKINLRYGLPEWNGEEETYMGSTDVYVACWSAGPVLETAMGTDLTEREIRIIASHFASALERKNICARVGVMCSFGVGTSRLLCEQLKSNFSRLQIVDILTPRDLEKMHGIGPFDFLISTVPLEKKQYSGDVIQIGNYLRKQDILSIQSELVYVCGKKMRSTKQRPASSNYPLFDPELVFHLNGEDRKERIIHRLCTALFNKGCVSREFEETVLHREENSSTLLSDLVAIPHGLPQYVLVPRIAVAFLDKPVPWEGEVRTDVIFMLAINFDSRFGAEQKVMGFYAALISLLENPKEFSTFRRLSSPQDIVRYLEQLIWRQLQEK